MDGSASLMYDFQLLLLDKMILNECLKLFVVETQMGTPSLSTWMPEYINRAVQEKSLDIL